MQWLFCPEISIYDIVSNFADLAFVRVIFFFWTFTEQCKLVHNSLDSLVIYIKTTVYKFPMYSSYTISSFILIENSNDFNR